MSIPSHLNQEVFKRLKRNENPIKVNIYPIGNVLLTDNSNWSLISSMVLKLLYTLIIYLEMAAP